MAETVNQQKASSSPEQTKDQPILKRLLKELHMEIDGTNESSKNISASVDSIRRESVGNNVQGSVSPVEEDHYRDYITVVNFLINKVRKINGSLYDSAEKLHELVGE